MQGLKVVNSEEEQGRFLQMEYGEAEQNMEMPEFMKRGDLNYEMPVGVAVMRGGHELYFEVVNREFMCAEGYSAAELTQSGRPYNSYIYHEDIDIFESAIEKCRKQKSTQTMEIRIKTKDGKIWWELVQCKLYYYKDAVPYYIVVSWDINERKSLEAELRLMDEQYRMLEEVSDEFPFEYDVINERFRVPQKYHLNGKVTARDKKYMSADEMMGDIYEEDQDVYRKTLRKASEIETTGSIDYRLNAAPAGEEPAYIWYRTIYRSIMGTEGRIIRIIGRSYDVSSDRKIQEQLSEEMRLDPLTRILNKVAAGEAVTRFLASNPSGVHVMFLIDIDDFKRINDTFGHTVGDTVISDIAQIIRERFRGTDIVARVGGDEFLAFMKNTTLEQAQEKAHALCREAAKRLIGDDAIVNVTLSIGLSVYGVDGEDYETLFQKADHAMYHTKGRGKNNYSFAKKGEREEDRRQYARMTEEGYLRSQEVDKEFLNFAFSLLSHARDINGSLNVLVEQIGKKYGLDFVSVFEYMEDRPEKVLTNCWSNFGQIYEKNVLPRAMERFEQAPVGTFISIDGEADPLAAEHFLVNWNKEREQIQQLAGVKFEFAGKRTGCLYVGVRHRKGGFNATEECTFCELARVVGVFVSLRNKLSDDQREIQQLQDQDMLTGLYNLEAFRKRMEGRMKRDGLFSESQEDKYLYALVHVDVNNFSYVNENFGQQVGDTILQELAGLIQGDNHVVEACRMYSDYFVELVKGDSEEEIYQKVLEENKAFETRQKIKYPASTMRLSAGICFMKDSKESFETILEGANLARKQAKEQKSNGAVIYKETMREKRDGEIHITGRFYGAMQKGELEVFLQPKFLLKEQKIYGAEALARWRTESGEVMSPNKFITPLENMGYIVDLDFYILEQLLRAMKRWKESGRKLFTISTNFSRRNFENGGADFIKRLQETMGRYQIEPRYIEIEVTESVIVDRLDSLKKCLGELEQLGYRIAIDDFGTGYSSLSVLLEIPANVVKIDKNFTDRINLAEQREFVSRMGQFIRAAKDEVIFEGIEKDEQRRFLLDCGFSYGQGYLFDRPLPLEEFERKYVG